MNNTIQNQTVGTEYSELYKKLRKEVAEQNAQTAQNLPTKAALSDREGDKIELRVGNAKTKDIEKLKEKEVKSAVNTLVHTIKLEPSSAYEAQNIMLASRIAALLKS